VKRYALAVLTLLLLLAPHAFAQQVPDPNFKFANAEPAFAAGKGPVVCIDEAHNNFHTAGGRYQSFAELLRADGYVVKPSAGKFTRETLDTCAVMTIANAIGDANAEDWAYPHPSAFSKDELNTLYTWLKEGGSLLLISDHAPMAGAASDLGALLGVAMFDGYASGPRSSDNGPPDVFSLADGTLKPHPILAGRNEKEAVNTVATFTGLPFHASRDFRPLMVFGPGSRAMTIPLHNFEGMPQAEWPVLDIAGWWHGATRTLGKGRVVILGEAAMCSAQLAGPEKWTMGMNHPKAAQNAQFCLNTVRWLTGVLEPPATEAQTKPQS
jgi:hypothetical protein